MDTPKPLTLTESTTSDQLTGLESGPLDRVARVRVEIVNTEQEQQPDLAADPDQSLDLDALRQTIARAEARISSVRELQQQLTAAQRRLGELERERDQLQRDLIEAHAQLAEVRALQRQLQISLEQA